jgi:hypothetical protein
MSQCPNERLLHEVIGPIPAPGHGEGICTQVRDSRHDRIADRLMTIHRILLTGWRRQPAANPTPTMAHICLLKIDAGQNPIDARLGWNVTHEAARVAFEAAPFFHAACVAWINPQRARGRQAHFRVLDPTSHNQRCDQQEVDRQARHILNDRADWSTPQRRIRSDTLEGPRQAKPHDCRNEASA